MKKVLFVFSLSLFLFCYFNIRPMAKNDDVSDYLTYQEIIMSSGKLIKNWTEEEKESVFGRTSAIFWGIVIEVENQNVEASYIASVKECIENASASDIEIEVSYTVETNTKVSFSASGSISGSGSGKITDIKAEAAAKAGVDYSSTTTTSVKEVRKMSIIVEGNSQYMVVTKGNMSITNGVVELYYFWIRNLYGCFEITTLQSQYAELEKRSL